MYKDLLHTVTLMVVLLAFAAAPAFANTEKSFFSLTATDIAGTQVPFSRFRGKVVLATNIALKCGTTPQLRALQALYQEYKSRGFVVLAFPTNDFSGNLEPTETDVIKHMCESDYGVTFPVFQQGPVRGAGKQRVFSQLTSMGSEDMRGEVVFNFEKFLLDRKGQLRQRFSSFTGAGSDVLREQIEKLLAESSTGGAP